MLFQNVSGERAAAVSASASAAAGSSSSSSALLLLCDVCHRQTTSLSDLQTYPCLHSFCVRCLNSSHHELHCCPLCRTSFNNYVQEYGGGIGVGGAGGNGNGNGLSAMSLMVSQPPGRQPQQPQPQSLPQQPHTQPQTPYNTTSPVSGGNTTNSSNSSSSGFNCQRYVEELPPPHSHSHSTSSRIVDTALPRIMSCNENVHLVKNSNGQNSPTSVVPQLSSLSICSSLRKIDISNVVLPLLPHYLPPQQQQQSSRVCCAEYACAQNHFQPSSFSKNHGGCAGGGSGTGTGVVDALLHNSPDAKSSSVSPVTCDVAVYPRSNVSSYFNCLTGASNNYVSAFGSGYCSRHPSESVDLYCDNCSRSMCRQCVAAEHPGHSVRPTSLLMPPPSQQLQQQSKVVDFGGGKKHAANSRIYGDVLHYIKNAEYASDMVEHMQEKVEMRLSSVSAEVRSVAHHLIAAIEERRDVLLQQVETVRARKGQVLNAQHEKLLQYLSKLNAILSSLEYWSPDSPEYEAKARTILKEQCGNISGLQPLLSPQEDDKVVFISPDSNLSTVLASFGFILSGAYAPNSVIVGEVSRHATKDKNFCLTVQAKSHVGEQCTTGGDHVSAIAYVPSGMTVPVKIMDKQNGQYLCSYTPSVEGEHKVHIFIRGLPIHDSPFVVNVKCGRDYCGIKAQPVFSFGGEGTANGQLCRPWGITCDRLGRIIVADRSNNRIQIFDKDGKFLTKFGSLGCRSGQFDRPAGVAVNSHNNIVVVDKDNHRIQVFAENGEFLFKFGEKGREPGRFNYPWDVAVNSEDVMAVSDTRNHRVQLFNTYGVFLKKVGFDSSLFYKQFDSPRGVAFSSDGRLFCTDFNNHRLVIAELKSDKLKFFGREGDGDGCFKRPQGIEIDAQDNVIVADSRNNRIQVFSPQLTFICNIGVHNVNAHPRSIMDRPCDVCVTPDGRIFVIDFGNNKIHAF